MTHDAATEALASQLGFDLGVHGMMVVEDGPVGQATIGLRFPLTFRETANLSRTLYFTHFAIWLGKLRELACQPTYDTLAAEFATGRWGMVTNSSETRIFGEVEADDVIFGRIWIDRLFGPHDSTQDLHYDWSKRLPEGGYERIAWSKMRATWVEILAHGVVEARPLPDYYEQFLRDNMVPASDVHSEPLPETVDEIDLGPAVFQAPPGPRPTVHLHEQIFETALEDSNLVGNIYFGNYTLWSGRTRDHFFQQLAPAYYRGTGEQGELRCLYTKVEHLREAMPFDSIVVRMSLTALHERGVRLSFEFFRVGDDGDREKLAYGEHVAGWFVPGEPEWALSPLPDDFRQGLLERAQP